MATAGKGFVELELSNNAKAAIDLIQSRKEKVLNFDSMRFDGKDDLYAIAEALRENPVYGIISLVNCGVTDEGFQLILKATKSSPVLTNIIMSFNKEITDASSSAIHNFILETKIDNFWLHDCSITIPCCIMIRTLLAAQKLKRFNWASNVYDFYNWCLDVDGMKLIAEHLKDNATAEEIRLNSSTLIDEGLVFIAKAIHGNKTLKTLDLSGNWGITDDSAEIIKDMIRSSHIVSLNLAQTQIEEEQKNEIKKLLEIPVNDRHLLFSESGAKRAREEDVEVNEEKSPEVCAIPLDFGCEIKELDVTRKIRKVIEKRVADPGLSAEIRKMQEEVIRKFV